MRDKNEKLQSEPRAGIYSICHTPSLRRYIGQSREVDRRIKVHKRKLHAGNHENPELQRCWNEAGPNEFTFFIIELAPNNLSALALQRWLWEREKKHWMDAGINTFNYQIPELVETQAAIEEYKKEKITETKKITRRIKDVNTLLEKVKKLERPKYAPISELIQAISELDKEIWKSTGWRCFFYWTSWANDLALLQADRSQKSSELESLDKKYRSKDRLRRELLDVRKDLYNSYPGNKEKKAKKYEVPLKVYGGKIKKNNKTILYY